MKPNPCRIITHQEYRIAQKKPLCQYAISDREFFYGVINVCCRISAKHDSEECANLEIEQLISALRGVSTVDIIDMATNEWMSTRNILLTPPPDDRKKPGKSFKSFPLSTTSNPCYITYMPYPMGIDLRMMCRFNLLILKKSLYLRTLWIVLSTYLYLPYTYPLKSA